MRLPGIPAATFAALERIRTCVLEDFSSLFTTGYPLWTLQNLERLQALFVHQFDKGEGDFFEKLRAQIGTAGEDVLQLAAELLYVQQFFTTLTGLEKKTLNVRTLLTWGTRPVYMPGWAIEGVRYGIAIDQSFNQHRPFHMAWLIEFLLAWHKSEQRAENLSDPWRFRSFAFAVEGSHGAHQPMREAWLYMMFPDTFEPMSSRTDKRAIRDAYLVLLARPPSEIIDVDLEDIRRVLEPRLGPGFNYYAAAVASEWRLARGEGDALPDVKREAIVGAFKIFDAEYRGRPEWSTWESNGSQKYAIEHEGHRYPPKQILSIATGRKRNTFSGGDQTNDYFRERLFDIVRLRGLVAADASPAADQDDELTWADAAELVLRAAGTPLTVDEIWEALSQESRFHTSHAEPKRALYTVLFRGAANNHSGRGAAQRPFIRVAPSTFGLVALGHLEIEEPEEEPVARPPTKRELVEQLKRDELLHVCEQYELEPDDRRVNDNLIDAIVRSKRVRTPEILSWLSRDRLKELCATFDLDWSGREKAPLIERLLGESPAAAEPAEELVVAVDHDAAAELAELLSPALKFSNVADGWPSRGTLETADQTLDVNVYVRMVGGSSRGNSLERRFQNPSKQHPIHDENGYELLLGIWSEQGESRTVIAAFDAYRRMERSTRFSMFMPLSLLEQAADTGYATHENNRGETLHAFRADNLQRYVQAFLEDGTWRGSRSPPGTPAAVAAASRAKEPTVPPPVAPAAPQTHTIDIRPQVGMYAAFSRLNYKPWFALAEFLDNSIQSFLSNRSELEAEGQSGPLVIDLNLDDNELSVLDRAGGIALKDFQRAFSPASPPADATGLSEFGLGMKAAACWFASRWSVRTSALGEAVVRTVSFDIPRISREGVENLPIETETARESDHYTLVTMKDLRVHPRGRTLTKIREHLSSIYRVLTSEGVVVIRLTAAGRSEELVYEPPALLEAPYHRTPNAAPILWRQEFEVDLDDRKVTGWAGVMRTGSHARAGFSVFRRRRLIEGSIGETYKPQMIFGSPNSFASQRVVGEIFVEGFEVTHTKDGIQWGPHEDEVLESIHRQINSPRMPLLDQADGYRSRRAASSLPKGFGVDALAATAEALSQPAAAEALQVVPTGPEADAPEQSPAPKPSIGAAVLQQKTFTVPVVRDGRSWTVQLKLVKDAALPFFTTAMVVLDGKDVLTVEINLDHDFAVLHINDNPSALDPLVHFVAALALGERIAREQGVKNAGVVRQNANEILKAIATNGSTR